MQIAPETSSYVTYTLQSGINKVASVDPEQATTPEPMGESHFGYMTLQKKTSVSIAGR